MTNHSGSFKLNNLDDKIQEEEDNKFNTNDLNNIAAHRSNNNTESIYLKK